MARTGLRKTTLSATSEIPEAERHRPCVLKGLNGDIKMTEEFAAGFDPQMLIDEARATAPQFPWLPVALSNCGAGEWESRAYVRYVSAVAPNRPESECEFIASVTIQHRLLGMVVIDILQGNRIGGIEFVERLG